MAEIKPVAPVTPLVALLLSEEAHFEPAARALEEYFGPAGLTSPFYPFTNSDYYLEEMGPDLSRRFMACRQLRDPAELADWKLATNAMEKRLASELKGPDSPRRPVNLDPGYLAGGKLLLASAKGHATRIYLRDGIYADLQLIFRKGVWLPQNYAFRDYAATTYHDFFSRARDFHLDMRKQTCDGCAK